MLCLHPDLNTPEAAMINIISSDVVEPILARSFCDGESLYYRITEHADTTIVFRFIKLGNHSNLY